MRISLYGTPTQHYPQIKKGGDKIPTFFSTILKSSQPFKRDTMFLNWTYCTKKKFQCQEKIYVQHNINPLNITFQK
jgi:hypothetical protein